MPGGVPHFEVPLPPGDGLIERFDPCGVEPHGFFLHITVPDFKLSVQFCEGVTKLYDVKPLFKRLPAFVSLKEHPDIFGGVSVDVGGYGIVWDNVLDLSCDELWENGVTVPTPFDGLIALSDATALWGLNESTLRKAISYGKLVNGVDVCKFGKQWVVSADAMTREYGAATR